jgi:hypothetical protein
MSTSVAPVGGGVAVVTVSEMPVDYPACIEPDVIGAGLLVFAALIAAWAPAYGLWRVVKFLNYSRGDANA